MIYFSDKKRDNKTVFDRLGEGSVSSTTSELSSGISHSSASTIPTLLNKEKVSVFKITVKLKGQKFLTFIITKLTYLLILLYLVILKVTY